MHIVIINSSPRTPSQSNTVRITEEFSKGLIRAGASVETYYLADRGQWEAIEKAFFRGGNILFAIPLFSYSVPGNLMEFFERLYAALNTVSSQLPPRKISFILQSAFPEACQRRCCEDYLGSIPRQLESQFAGILSHGNTYGMTFGDAQKAGTSATYEEMGELFAAHDATFFFQEAIDFNGPEYITDKEAKRYNRVFRFFCEHTAEARGCTQDLMHKPYQEG